MPGPVAVVAVALDLGVLLVGRRCGVRPPGVVVELSGVDELPGLRDAVLVDPVGGHVGSRQDVGVSPLSRSAGPGWGPEPSPLCAVPPAVSGLAGSPRPGG